MRVLCGMKMYAFETQVHTNNTNEPGRLLASIPQAWADTYRGVGLTALRNALGVSMFFAFVAATEDLREQVSDTAVWLWSAHPEGEEA